MKNLILSALLLVLTISSYAQTTITCKSRETCWYNTKSQEFDLCTDDVFDNSVFVMNKNEDMLIHRTSSMTSTYYVTASQSEEDFINYTVISDVGNEYIIMFDIEKLLVKFIGTDLEGNLFITMYSVKSVF
jgi:hypothetical protein